MAISPATYSQVSPTPTCRVGTSVLPRATAVQHDSNGSPLASPYFRGYTSAQAGRPVRQGHRPRSTPGRERRRELGVGHDRPRPISSGVDRHGGLGLAARIRDRGPGPSPSTRPSARRYPTVVLTVQSGLPDSDSPPTASTIPNPGRVGDCQALTIRGTPHSSPGATTVHDPTDARLGRGRGRRLHRRRATTALIHRPTPPSTSGVDSEMRFVGIGGNETTGQQRIPVIMTSIHDSTVGRSRSTGLSIAVLRPSPATFALGP